MLNINVSCLITLGWLFVLQKVFSSWKSFVQEECCLRYTCMSRINFRQHSGLIIHEFVNRETAMLSNKFQIYLQKIQPQKSKMIVLKEVGVGWLGVQSDVPAITLVPLYKVSLAFGLLCKCANQITAAPSQLYQLYLIPGIRLIKHCFLL